jgi:transposase
MMEISSDVFKFSGQVHLDTYALELERVAVDLDRYDDVAVNGLRLSLEAIRKKTDEFAYWQRRGRMGRPAYEERTLLVSFLVQQLLGLTFRETEGVLRMVRSYYRLDRIPDHSTLSRKLSSKRWTTVLERFFQHLLAPLPRRQTVIATDATGYSGRKRGWRETKHAQRASEDWVKVHAAIEVDEFIVLSFELTSSNVHDSQMFASVWDRLPKNVSPKRSLADSAYHGEKCLAAARQHGATPLHGIKRNARHFSKPRTNYQKMASFWQHWPNRAAELYGKRNHAETAFSMIGGRFGHRIRCRSEVGRKNEVCSKIASHNIRMLAWMSFKSSD